MNQTLIKHKVASAVVGVSHMRTPTQKHWQVLEQVDNLRSKMSLVDFMDNWQLSRRELTRITGTEISTVNKWLAPSSPSPAPFRMQTLVLLHIFWQQQAYTRTEQILKIEAITINPQLFLTQWSVTQNQLAYLCQCSRHLVNKWFRSSDKKMIPRFNITLSLGLVNYFWQQLSNPYARQYRG